jgi:hypothetical protein
LVIKRDVFTQSPHLAEGTSVIIGVDHMSSIRDEISSRDPQFVISGELRRSGAPAQLIPDIQTFTIDDLARGFRVCEITGDLLVLDGGNVLRIPECKTPKEGW